MQKFEVDELVAQATASGRDFNTELCELAAKKRQNQIVNIIEQLRSKVDEDFNKISDESSEEAETSYLNGKSFSLYTVLSLVTGKSEVTFTDTQRLDWLLNYFISTRTELDDMIVSAETVEALKELIDSALKAENDT